MGLFKARAGEARKPEADRFTFSATAPAREIDFIFFAPPSEWRAREVTVVDERVASDHRPVVAVLERVREGKGGSPRAGR
jgi:endonuclease/exonuclease/phosphatase family metal-dependent hydrolase